MVTIRLLICFPILLSICAEFTLQQEKCVGNIRKILFWHKGESNELSPQFVMGVTIGLGLLKGSDLSDDKRIENVI